MSDTATPTAPKATRKTKTVTEDRSKAIPVWIDNEATKIGKSFDEKDWAVYGAAVLAFSKLSIDDQMNFIAAAKKANAMIHRNAEAASEAASTVPPSAV